MNGLSRRGLKNALLRSRVPFKSSLARGYLRTIERYRSYKSGQSPDVEANGLPLPSSRLRVLVTSTGDAEMFLKSGEAHSLYLRKVVNEAGCSLEEMDTILDFGCGCGRIVRWFADLKHTEISACDYNTDLVAWCNANLPFVNASANALDPPLPYADTQFDFLYAYSVFTHLSVELANLWLTELARVVKPGGLMWFTVHGESYRQRLLPEEKMRFDAGEIVVWLPEIQGTNLCGAYWPHTAVERMLADRFKVLVHLNPLTEPDQATSARLSHDAYLVERVQEPDLT